MVDRTLCGGDHLGVVSRRAEKAYECGPSSSVRSSSSAPGSKPIEARAGPASSGWCRRDVGGGALDEAVETVQSRREGLHVEVVLAGKRSGEA